MSHRSSIPGCGVTFEIVSNIPEVKDRMKFEFTKNKHVKRANSPKVTYLRNIESVKLCIWANAVDL